MQTKLMIAAVVGINILLYVLIQSDWFVRLSDAKTDMRYSTTPNTAAIATTILKTKIN